MEGVVLFGENEGLAIVALELAKFEVNQGFLKRSLFLSLLKLVDHLPILLSLKVQLVFIVHKIRIINRRNSYLPRFGLAGIRRLII